MKEVKFAQDCKPAAPAEDEEDMCPGKAAKLYSEGGFYIVKDLPVGTEFGCDMKSFNTGPKFLGLKMIPKGCHFIYYNLIGKNSDVSLRRGLFINIEPGDVIVHRFDPKSEDIVDDVRADEMERLRLNLKNIDGQLGAYPIGSWAKWVGLSNRLNIDLIKKYQARSDGDNSLLDVTYNFTEVRRQKYPDGASASEISRHCLDSSYQLDTWLNHHDNIEAVLQELQLAFILFLVGQDYESFNHWKLVVDMMCGCGESLVKYPQLFTSFINDLHFQLQEVPEDFFVDIISCNNFLVSSLTNLFSNIREYEACPSLKSKAISFENHLTKKFGWCFEDENDDEYSPVVVVT